MSFRYIYNKYLSTTADNSEGMSSSEHVSDIFWIE